ncbi:hypothetical protein [Amycolatopsis sp. SID8362]|uniref:hypothetical protein n=1 Tax=Amycolatopsis sp. SID8362 TaxID=2690346 RepID=UPI00136D0224|nr:hypothetical protein [Amycolatopsis sp. SID8362]NBH04880.1 hypothetical protein [Amycolatopsis sp. SID8362]NED41581.1 hypothetical protein [Amycolatopsis sp. SID8362]
MENSEDRTPRLEVTGSQYGGPRCRVPGDAPERSPGNDVECPPTPWRKVIDGWVRDGSIRRDALVALALVLIAVVTVVGAIAGALCSLLREAAVNPAVRLATGSLLAGGLLGCGALRMLQRRLRRASARKAAMGKRPRR